MVNEIGKNINLEIKQWLGDELAEALSELLSLMSSEELLELSESLNLIHQYMIENSIKDHQQKV
ncbi:hypothetical protein [Paenibacillus silviterrae]|uniref:hypothetical protein n=1 Tax=Paenibacillus silviterrae TaxID=3242194 RepID=UPI002542C90A|nr:hypothetical protein [Paenibacillus chinjuensis]